jgi:hypothetical protein
MKIKLLPAPLLLLAILALSSCGSGGSNEKGYLPGDVVSNPNTANGNADPSTLPVISFDKKEHDFGKIVEGESVSYEFAFTNTGKSDLVITDVSTSCGCTVPSYPKNAIRPGRGGVIRVAFNSRGKHGVQNKAVVVVANTQPNVTQLKIKAQVVSPGGE